MRYWGVLALAASVAAAGCGSDSPSTPSQPTTVTFTAALLPSNEAPSPVTGAEASGRGTATITFNLTRDSAGAIQSGSILFRYDLTAFPAGTTINLSHIHTGAAGVGGPILIGTGQTSATALGLPNGAGSYEITATTADAASLQAIIDNPANFYFNVHSSLNPGGVARGQLVKQ
jgi:CHRD domain